MQKEKIVISGACRSPIGVAFKGKLAELTATDLLTACFQETARRANFDRKLGWLDEAIVGQVAQSSDAPNIARVALLKTLGKDAYYVPAFTVQRNCGSGLQALASAVDHIRLGVSQIALVGGVESMSSIGCHFPAEVVRKGKPYRPGERLTLTDDLDQGLTDPYTGELMGKTADNVARKYDVNRKDQDKYAARSHQLAFRAQRGGKFDPQIVPIEVKRPFGVKPETITQDEGINPGLNEGILSQYPSLFLQEGTVTGGNACQISDGAASFFVMLESEARRLGMPIDAEVVDYAFVGCHPSYMGMGPAHAIPKLLLTTGIRLGMIDLWELNEAFAAQVLACQRKLEISDEKLNLWGGAIAMGHPVGATGAILTVKMAHMLKDLDKEYGIVSLCIGGGQGGALLMKRVT